MSDKYFNTLVCVINSVFKSASIYVPFVIVRTSYFLQVLTSLNVISSMRGKKINYSILFYNLIIIGDVNVFLHISSFIKFWCSSFVRVLTGIILISEKCLHINLVDSLPSHTIMMGLFTLHFYIVKSNTLFLNTFFLYGVIYKIFPFQIK